jgi:hypothetical protein
MVDPLEVVLEQSASRMIIETASRLSAVQCFAVIMLTMRIREMDVRVGAAS